MTKKTKTMAKKQSSTIVSQLLSEIAPVEKLQANIKMNLAARLDDLIKSKGWGKSEFAEKVNKNPSEITKWLSGTQNFTLDTLAEIALALNMPVEELFRSEEEPVLNKVHILITVNEVPASIKYETPVSKLKNKWPTLHSESHFGAVVPMTFRMQQQA